VPVLAVDDDAQVLSSLCGILADRGYNTAGVTDATSAVKALNSDKFDVVLYDLADPRSHSMQFLREFRCISQDLLIMVMSIFADLATVRKAVDLGANDYLVKPFSISSVPISVERNLYRREAESKRLVEQRNKVLLGSIKALSAAMYAKERSGPEHSERIRCLALCIAESIGLSDEEKSTLELAAYLHDIGQIGVREDMLIKPGELSEAEWNEIKMHPETGSRILSNIEELSELADVIRHHHERWDGAGYPDGLAGEEIPLLSRILVVADSFAAMTSDRPYRARMTEGEAIRQLQEASGTQFDWRIVAVLLHVLENAEGRAA
jgi:putative nucleotidyltransferase with HDIG domain